MLDLLPIIVPLLLVDVLNPVLLAATIYSVGTDNPYKNSLSLLGGHTVTYFALGIAIALGLDRIMSYLANPTVLDFGMQIVIGVALMLASFRAGDGRAADSTKPPGTLATGSAFLYGVTISFLAVPFALPYFAFLDQLLKADLAWQPALTLMVAYNLLYVLPFLLIPAMLAILGEHSQVKFRTISRWVDAAADWMMPKLLVVLGFVLIADSAMYFAVGSGFL